MGLSSVGKRKRETVGAETTARFYKTTHIIAIGLSSRGGERTIGCFFKETILGQMVMDKTEAKKILTAQLDLYRKRSHSELTQLINQPETLTVTGDSGTNYGLELEVVWDGEPGKDLRVMGSIDDGGWRAFCPLSEDFIMRNDGSFVGE